MMINAFPNKINYFNDLILPRTSKLIIDLPNKKLSFKTMKINGNIQTKSGSAVIQYNHRY